MLTYIKTVSVIVCSERECIMTNAEIIMKMVKENNGTITSKVLLFEIKN